MDKEEKDVAESIKKMMITLDEKTGFYLLGTLFQWVGETNLL